MVFTSNVSIKDAKIEVARPLMVNSTVCREFVGEFCEYKGLEIVAVKDC